MTMSAVTFTRFLRVGLCGVFVILSAAAQLAAQSQSLVLDMPLVSQRAAVSQRVGLTDLTVTYHRPLVNGRKVLEGLVPYGQVWRAGANENTTLEVTDDVMVEGQPLSRGVYGLHMIPGKETWTVIFSKNSTSWGSFTYDKGEDALRVDVKAGSSLVHEALTYEFTGISADAAVLELMWADFMVPVRFTVDTKSIAVASMRRQLRGLIGYTWIPWNDAAVYCLENKTNLEEALKWADTSIQNEERYENLDTKAQILGALGQTAESASLTEKALARATPLQTHYYARRLISQKKPQEAMKVFQENAARHPDLWFVHVGLARGHSALGDRAAATRELKLALDAAPKDQKGNIEGQLKRAEQGEDINQ
jgi:hypothetical protein